MVLSILGSSFWPLHFALAIILQNSAGSFRYILENNTLVTRSLSPSIDLQLAVFWVAIPLKNSLCTYRHPYLWNHLGCDFRLAGWYFTWFILWYCRGGGGSCRSFRHLLWPFCLLDSLLLIRVPIHLHRGLRFRFWRGWRFWLFEWWVAEVNCSKDRWRVPLSTRLPKGISLNLIWNQFYTLLLPRYTSHHLIDWKLITPNNATFTFKYMVANKEIQIRSTLVQKINKYMIKQQLTLYPYILGWCQLYPVGVV